MVSRRDVFTLGGAAAVAAVGAGSIAVDAKKKSKKVTRTFSNTGAINTTNAGGAAAPYPSTIQVSGFKKGKILQVKVSLNGFTASVPDDIDVMLSASQISGKTAVIMSDVGGAVAVSNLNLVLSDSATNELPNEAPLEPFASGTYKPANNVGGGVTDPFPAPAPTPSSNSALSVFNGANPNGTWQLWVIDSTGNGPAQFSGGWSIEITAKVKKKKKKK